MPKVIFHIGAHKTASTSVQAWFFRNRARLEQAGVIYPRTNWHHLAQHRLAFALKGGKPPRSGARADIASEIDGLNAVIAAAPDDAQIFVSSEEFFSAPRKGIRALRNRLCCDDVAIVAFLRKPDDLFLSIYNQRAKEPRNSFCKPVGDFLDRPYDLSPDLNMRKCINNWIAVFGQDRIKLRLYEEDPPLETIVQMLGLPCPAADDLPRANRSVPSHVADVMRLGKRVGLPLPMRRALLSVAKKLFRNSPGHALTWQQRQTIRRFCQPDLDALFARFGRANPYRAEPVEPPAAEPEGLGPVRRLVGMVRRALVRRSDKSG